MSLIPVVAAGPAIFGQSPSAADRMDEFLIRRQVKNALMQLFPPSVQEVKCH